MKPVSLVIAILVAFGAAGIAFLMANAQTEELKIKISDLEEDLSKTRAELARTRQELAKADTAKLDESVNELSEALWAKVGDLNNKDAQLDARIDKLASRPAPAPAAAPRVAGNPDDPDADPETETVREVLRGAGKMFQGARDRMVKRQVDNYKEKLNLTEAQALDMQELFKKQAEKAMENFGKAFRGGEDGENLDPQALMEQFTKERDESLKEILTPEQFEEFKKLEQDQMGRWGGGGFMPGGRRGGRRQPRDGNGQQ